MEVLETLCAKVGFTDTEIKIANYVLAHCRQISGMSADALARETFSSKASVIRMCRKMGLSGYREFQIELVAHLSKRESGVPPVRAVRNQAFGSVMQGFSKIIAEAAENCMNCVSEEALTRAVTRISRANRLYVYSAEPLNAVAFAHMLSALGIPSMLPGFFHESPVLLDGDVALFLSRSEDALRGLRKEMAALRRGGCQVILISTETACPDADISIGVPMAPTNSVYEEMAYTQTAFLHMMACIGFMVSGNRMERGEDKIESADRF